MPAGQNNHNRHHTSKVLHCAWFASGACSASRCMPCITTSAHHSAACTVLHLAPCLEHTLDRNTQPHLCAGLPSRNPSAPTRQTPLLCRSAPLTYAQVSGGAKVDQLDALVALGEDAVLGLDVAVHNACSKQPNNRAWG